MQPGEVNLPNSAPSVSGTAFTPPTTPQVTRRDPSLITVANVSVPNKPKTPILPKFIAEKRQHAPQEIRVSHKRRFFKYLYNREKKTFCDRTCKSWIKIVTYTIMYLIFLTTYTMIFLYFSLRILRDNQDFSTEVLLLKYSDNNEIGLSASPTSEDSYPLIWYRHEVENDYKKYVNALDHFLVNHKSKRDIGTDLGPCGQKPYGYGEKPCILFRINKKLKWSGIPLQVDSPNIKEAPIQVQNWVKKDQKKFWLHCSGYHSYDREHLGTFKYYPNPPAFDSSLFPLDMNDQSPLVALQVSNFTLGISLSIECKLWFHSGTSSVDFMLYVSPKNLHMKSLSGGINPKKS